MQRKALAEKVGASIPTVARAVTELIAEHLIAAEPSQHPKPQLVYVPAVRAAGVLARVSAAAFFVYALGETVVKTPAAADEAAVGKQFVDLIAAGATDVVLAREVPIEITVKL
jgi:DNA-binding transcriptional MocR family regulator